MTTCSPPLAACNGTPRRSTLSADTRALTALTTEDRATLTELVAGFHVAEHAVADELAPYVGRRAPRARRRASASPCRPATRRVTPASLIASAGELLGLDAGEIQRAASTSIHALFGDQLPATARALAQDAGTIAAAVGLYHLVIEGIVVRGRPGGADRARLRPRPAGRGPTGPPGSRVTSAGTSGWACCTCSDSARPSTSTDRRGVRAGRGARGSPPPRAPGARARRSCATALDRGGPTSIESSR